MEKMEERLAALKRAYNKLSELEFDALCNATEAHNNGLTDVARACVLSVNNFTSAMKKLEPEITAIMAELKAQHEADETASMWDAVEQELIVRKHATAPSIKMF